MPTEYVNLDDITEARRDAIEESIRTITVDELRAVGEALFPQADHPWREVLSNFLSQNAGATYHYATTHDRVHVVYCRAKEKGMWFVPGLGAGPLQAKGLAILKEIVDDLQ